MLLSSLKLSNFRNINGLFEPAQRGNCIIAPNGSGKSNLLDAIYHLSCAKSFRAGFDGQNINWNKNVEFCTIEGELNASETLKIVFSKNLNREKRKLFVDGISRALSTFTYKLLAVTFTPQSMNLVSGSPSLRRLELDNFLCMLSTSYRRNLREYAKVLRNRNRLLLAVRENIAHKDELIFWTGKLHECGSEILFERVNALKHFNLELQQIAGKYMQRAGEIGIVYISKFADCTSLEETSRQFGTILKENINREILVGRSLYGPHKDDFDLTLHKKSMKTYASRGQQRMGALILKVAMAEETGRALDKKPVLLLDDIFSELDDINANDLANWVEEGGCQYFLTAAEEKYIPKEILNACKSLKF